MQPLGQKILVKDITEKESVTEGGIIVSARANPYRTIEIVKTSPDSKTKLKTGDRCLAEAGGVELEPTLWLCNESLLVAKL